jgi:pyruvate/2-oxoacid:ferredoxin oxidoreductase alpha subunit
VVGNLIAAFMIVRVTRVMFYIIMTLLTLVASFAFLPLTNPHYEIEEEQLDPLTLRKSVSLKEVSDTNQETVNFRQIFHFIATRRFGQLVPLIVLSAISLAGASGILVPLMNDTMYVTLDDTLWNNFKQDQMALFALVALGVGEILFCISYAIV